jgi:hypothetical protein
LRYELDGDVHRGVAKASGRLMILEAANNKPGESPFIARPTIFGFGIDLMKSPLGFDGCSVGPVDRRYRRSRARSYAN